MDNGVLANHTPFIEADPDFDLSNYFENTLELMRRGERIYGVPLDFTPMVMYYNKKLFDQAGVPYPQSGWTWDEFLATARKLTIRSQDADTPAQFGFAFENIMPFWVLWLWNAGGDVLDPSGKRASGYLDSPETIAAVQFLVDLMHKHHVASTLQEAKVLGVDPFRSGLAAMDLKGHWKMIDYGADGMDVGVVGLPTRLPRRETVVYVSGLSVTARAKHPKLAWEYVKFMTSKGVQVRRVASGLAISGNKPAAAEFAGTPTEDAFIEEVKYARRPWGASVERYPFIEGLGREMMEEILYGGPDVDVATILRRTAKLIDAALAK
jgi:multiple sugar transport system substrate-binding protein